MGIYRSLIVIIVPIINTLVPVKNLIGITITHIDCINYYTGLYQIENLPNFKHTSNYVHYCNMKHYTIHFCCIIFCIKMANTIHITVHMFYLC